MSAREIIADMLARHEGRKYVFGQDHDLADTIVEQLAAAGYRILAPGEMDQETVERCAALAETYEHRTSAWQIDSIPWFAKGVATAIRSLGRRA